LIRALATPLAAAAQADSAAAGFPVGTELRDLLNSIWHFQIASIRQEPLTLGTIVTSLVLLAAGYWFSRLLSRLLAKLLASRFAVERGAALAIRSLTFYLLFAFFAVSSLALVNFPMTAFTIAGGAIAIGIGFGSQNVMKNFISGLILNVERPVRVGDFVLVDQTYGTIERIGARSTVIRASNNTQMIVPNSFFVENPLTNFTLTDDIVRSQLTVGVIYGSPTREVARLIHQAILEHPSVLKDREPRIVFEDFGDNSLVFDAYFWLRARSMLEQKQIQSDLRFRIDDLFREAHLVIAFPQRDVHLDSVRPIEVRVLPESRGAVS
jgi:potassium efflux system protein